MGTFASTGLGAPIGLAIDKAGNLYVANEMESGWVEKFSPTGTDLGMFGSAGLNWAYGLAFDSGGNLYVASYRGNDIHKFDPTGADLGVFATTDSGGPTFIAFAPIPEPSSLLLVAFGVLGIRLLFVARHRLFWRE